MGDRTPPDGHSKQYSPQRLRDVFLFREWSDSECVEVARLSKRVRHRKGDILFLHGGSCEFLYILLSGRVQMFRSVPDGREVTLHELSPGALIACIALFLDKSFPASARVISRDAEILYLQGAPFLRMLAARPDLSRKLIGTLASRLTELADRIESRTMEAAPARLAGWLLDQTCRSDDNGNRVIHIEGTKKSVAASLGMTPETFSRTLRELSREGILEVRGKDIVLLDPKRLSEWND